MFSYICNINKKTMNMVELKEKASSYAVENVLEILKEAFAKVYADGYRDGYKDREDEIPVDIRGNKTVYVDLGLPSGTLWSTDYEKEGDEVKYLRFSESLNYDIPTEKQWEELCENCRWERTLIGDTYRIDCIGPKNKISLFPKGKIENELVVRPDRGFFWLIDNGESLEKASAYMGYHNGVIRKSTTNYIGYKLPIRLVKTKKEE